MRQTCEDCARLYDDAEQSTLCPHAPLGVAREDFCPVHDLARPYQPEAFDALGCPHEKRSA